MGSSRRLVSCLLATTPLLCSHWLSLPRRPAPPISFVLCPVGGAVREFSFFFSLSLLFTQGIFFLSLSTQLPSRHHNVHITIWPAHRLDSPQFNSLRRSIKCCRQVSHARPKELILSTGNFAHQNRKRKDYRT